jgi:polyvinyl alcohol dehydrogenase (cytochrome)
MRRIARLLIPMWMIILIAYSSAAVLSQKRAKPAAQPAGWPMYGRDIAGSHYNPDETALTPSTVSQLKTKWVFETGADVSSQPAVVDGVVYFGSWDGKEYAVDAKTGTKIWEYDCGSPSRSGAAYDNGMLYFGDLAGRLYALDAKTGALKWKDRIDPHMYTVATSSPIVYNGRLYIGVASHEEGGQMRDKDYACCTFRGGVAAYDLATHKQVWRFYTIPDEAKKMGVDDSGHAKFGPAGGSVWSTVSIDPAANRLYTSTGNQYAGEESKFTDSVIALALDTGKAVWTYQATPADVFVIGCPKCGPDFDFGTIPLSFKGAGGKRLIGAGQKSGWFHALDAATGQAVWRTEVGPGSALGGIEFGNATDGERVYAALAHRSGGAVAMMDGATGNIVWKTMSPDKKPNYGPITVTGRGDDRLVFAGSTAGFIRAYDAKDGRILWEYDTGGAVGGGPTVVDGVVYVGSGYAFLRIGKPNKKLYAFSLDGK